MGFDCEMYKVKKFKNETFEDYNLIQHKLFFDTHYAGHTEQTFKEHYEEEDYWSHDKRVYPGDPDLETYNYYKDTKVDEIEDSFYCSSGRYIDDYIMNYFEPNTFDENYLFTNEIVDKLIKDVNDYLNDNRLVPVYLKRSFKYKYEDEEDDEPQIVTSKADGIEVEDEDGNIIRIDCSDEYETTLFTSKNRYFEPDKYTTMQQFKQNLEEIKKINLDEYFVYYSRSY